MLHESLVVRATYDRGAIVMPYVRIGDGSTVHAIPPRDVLERMVDKVCRAVEDATPENLAAALTRMLDEEAKNFPHAVEMTPFYCDYRFPGDGTVRELSIGGRLFRCPTPTALPTVFSDALASREPVTVAFMNWVYPESVRARAA